MAVTEYIVLAGMQERTASPLTTARKVKKGSGATAKAEIEERMLDAQFFRVLAESNEEAILMVRSTYPGVTNDKMFSCKQSLGEEL